MNKFIRHKEYHLHKMKKTTFSRKTMDKDLDLIVIHRENKMVLNKIKILVIENQIQANKDNLE